MPDLKQLIDLNYISMSIVILLVFGVVSLGIACAFVIVILKPSGNTASSKPWASPPVKPCC